MTVAERKQIIAENYAINSKKTPRTSRMAFARAHRKGVVILDPAMKARLTTYVDD